VVNHKRNVKLEPRAMANWNAEVESHSPQHTVPRIWKYERPRRDKRVSIRTKVDESERRSVILCGASSDDGIAVQKCEGMVATLGEHLESA
jgi:hypothetical protein